MSLVAQLPGVELYAAIFTAFRGLSDVIKAGVPVIIEAPIIIQGEVRSWGGNDAIVVVSEATDDFSFTTNGVKVLRPGALYYKNSRRIFAYLKSKRLLEVDIVINNHGIFADRGGLYQSVGIRRTRLRSIS